MRKDKSSHLWKSDTKTECTLKLNPEGWFFAIGNYVLACSGEVGYRDPTLVESWEVDMHFERRWKADVDVADEYLDPATQTIFNAQIYLMLKRYLLRITIQYVHKIQTLISHQNLKPSQKKETEQGLHKCT